MRTVLNLITGLGLGGAEQNLVRLAVRLGQKYYHPVVVSMTDVGPMGMKLQAADVEVHALGMKPGTPSPVGFWRLVRILGRYRPLILHCWMYHANLLGALAARACGVGHLVWEIRCSDMLLSRYGTSTRAAVKLGAVMSRWPEAIVVNSEAGRKIHAGWGFDESRMTMIYNGFETEIFKPDPVARANVRQELGLQDPSVLIGHIARFDPMKGHETFFEAAAKLVHTDPAVHFLLAGSGVTWNNPQVRRLIRSRGLERRVHLLGPREDIPRLTAALDIASSCSSFGEGLPNTIGEAMSSGIPCVVTDVGDSAALVGAAGRVVPRNDPEGLRLAWADLLRIGPEGRAKLGHLMRSRIKDEFSMARFVSAYGSLYDSLVNRPLKKQALGAEPLQDDRALANRQDL